MSYARFGEGSDVYVFHGDGGWHATTIDSKFTTCFPTREACRDGLRALQMKGYALPDEVFERLDYEIETGRQIWDRGA